MEVPNFPELVARVAERALARPGRSLAIALGLVVLGVIASLRVSFDPSPEAFLEGTDSWADYKRIDETYGIGETVIVGIRELGGTVFDPETIQVVVELDKALSELKGVRRVLSLASANVLGRTGHADETQRGQEDSIDVGPLLPPGPVTPASAMLLAQRVRDHTIYRNLLIDSRHETTYLLVQIDPKMLGSKARIELVDQIRREVEQRRSAHRTMHLAGAPVTKAAVAHSLQRDVRLFFPAAALLLVVLMWVMFGHPISSLVPISVVFFVNLLVLGAHGLFGIPLNLATAAVPTMILVIGLADSVHFLSELRRQYSRTGDREVSLINTIRAIAMPSLLTSATAAVGFGALMGSHVIPLRQFGVITAIGLLLTYAASMVLTPLLLHVLRFPRGEPAPPPPAQGLGELVSRVATAGAQRLPLTIGALGITIGACAAALGHLSIDSDIVGYLGRNDPVRLDREVIDRSLGGANSLELLIDGGQPGVMFEPEKLAAMDRLAQAMRTTEGMARTFGFVDYVKFAQMILTGVKGIPATREGVAQLVELNPEGFEALVAPDRRQSRMLVAVPSLSSEATLEAAKRVEELAKRVLAGSGLEVTVTGVPRVYAQVAHFLVEDARHTFLWAAIAIFFALVLGIRNPMLALVAMLPALLPVGLAFATMLLFGIPLDMNIAFVASIGIGITVNSTIHILARYQRAREQGSPTPARAIQYAMTQAGQPVILTSILLVVGFSVLCLSEFRPSMQLGILAGLMLIFAVGFDLFVLPILLVASDRFSAHFEPKVRTRPSEVTGHFRRAASHLTSSEGEPAPTPETKKAVGED